MNEIDIKKDAIGTMIGSPIEFRICGKDYKTQPPTFGKLQVMSKMLLDINFDEEKLKTDPYKESLRICIEKTDAVCRFIAVMILDSKEDILDDEKIQQKANEIKWGGNILELVPAVAKLITQLDCANFTTTIALMQTLKLNNANEVAQAVG